MFNKIILHYKNNFTAYVQLLIITIFILIFVEIVAFRYNPYDNSNTFKNPILDATVLKMNSCNVKTDNSSLQDVSEFLKGEKYITAYSDKENKKYRRECIISNWNLFHFCSHLTLAFLFPQCWITILLVSGLYEIYEYIVFQAHDYGDILYNVSGIIVGLIIRSIL